MQARLNEVLQQPFPRTLDIWLLRSPLIDYEWKVCRPYSSISAVGRAEAVIEFRLIELTDYARTAAARPLEL